MTSYFLSNYIFFINLKEKYSRAQNVINLLNSSKKFQPINAEIPSGQTGVIS